MTVLGGAALDAAVEPDRTVLAACEAIHGVLGEYAAIPAGMAPSLSQHRRRCDSCSRKSQGRRSLRPPTACADRALGLAGTAAG